MKEYKCEVTKVKDCLEDMGVIVQTGKNKFGWYCNIEDSGGRFRRTFNPRNTCNRLAYSTELGMLVKIYGYIEENIEILRRI